MNSINFDNPWLLFLILPLVALVAAPFAFAVRSDNRNGHNIASLVLHILMAVIVAFAAAGTSVVTVITETDVFVVADVSYSAKRNLDTVDGYIANLQNNLPRNSKLGVVCFGKDCTLLTEPGEEIASVKTAAVDETETDIVGALEFTGTLFKADVIKRIVVITDGRQSDLRSSNSLKRAVDNLALKGVKVDAIYLDDNIGDGKEIQISYAEFAKTAFLNAEENKVTAFVQSSYSAPNMEISLRSGDNLVDKKIVNLSVGSNPVIFTLPSEEQGSFDYEISVDGLDGDEDFCEFNNRITFTQNVSDAVNVLLVTEKAANEQYIKNLYGEKSNIESYVVTEGSRVPSTVELLCKYDEIVLADVDLKKLDLYKMFVDSLDKVVSVFGKNLVTFGNLEIQNTKDSALKELDDMLPVRFGHNDEDPKLYTVVVDTSRSMETNQRLIMAKEAIRQILNLLGNNDNICIVEFNGDVRVALTPTPASRRDTINDVIDDLGVLQGTLIYKGLEEAYKQISALTMYKERQVMLVTDGLSYSAETDTALDIANRMSADNIKISVIDVGRGGDYNTTPAAQAAVKLLNDIATAGRGEYFYTLTPEDLEKLFLKDIADDITQPIIEKHAEVIRNRRQDPVLDGFPEDAGSIEGVINNSAKGSATTVLKAEYFKDVTQVYVQVPLYAYWTYGNGRVSSFTSAVSGGWTDGWQNKDNFLGNVLKTNVPAEKCDRPYLLDVTTEGKFSTLKVTPLNLYSEIEAEIKVTSPGGAENTYALEPDSTGYLATFETSEVGKYDISVSYKSDGENYDCVTVMNSSYKSEYDLFAGFDASELYKMVGGNGTVSEDGNLKIVNDIRDVGTHEYSLVVPLLAVCAALFVVDIIVRKLKWNDIKNLFIRVK